jgi:hypothetical protein
MGDRLLSREAVSMRKTVRLAAVLVLAAFVIIPNAVDFALPWHPWTWYGFTVAADGVVTSADSKAERSGLRAGDRILAPQGLTTIALPDLPLARNGRSAILRVASHGRIHDVRIFSHPHPRTLWDNVTNEILTMSVCAFVAIAALLVLLRPRPATWAFLILAVGASPAAFLPIEYLPAIWANVSGTITGDAGVFGGVAFLIFAMRFPDVRQLPRVRWIESTLIAASLLIAVLKTTGHTPDRVELFAAYTPIAAGVAVMIWRLRHAPEADRAKLRWIFAAFTIAWIPTMAIGVFERVAGILPPLPIDNLAFSVQIVAAIAVAYTVMKHRLFDIRFIINRAAVFSIVSLILVGAFVLVEWLLTDWLRDASHASNMIAGAALALGLGLSVRTVHRRVDALMDYMFFRQRHENESAIKRFTEDAPYITDAAVLVERTVATLKRHTDADFVMLRECIGDWENDPAVVRMRATHKPVDLNTVETMLPGDLAFPMRTRGQVPGVLILGPRRTGETFAPDEIDVIDGLAHSVAGALEAMRIQTDPTLQRIEMRLDQLAERLTERGLRGDTQTA